MSVLRQAIEASQAPHWRGGYVYIGRAHMIEIGWKIGYTRDSIKRLQSLKSTHGIADYVTVIACEHPRVVELAMHRLFHVAKCEWGREWFRLTELDCQWAAQLMPLHGNRIVQFLLDSTASPS